MTQPILSRNAREKLEKILTKSDDNNGHYSIPRDRSKRVYGRDKNGDIYAYGLSLPSSVGPKALAYYCYSKGWAFSWSNQYYDIDTRPERRRNLFKP